MVEGENLASLAVLVYGALVAIVVVVVVLIRSGRVPDLQTTFRARD